MKTRDCDVAIVGAGPAGATMANLLACYGLSVIVLDREAGVVEEPRAVGIDDEALRTLQSFDMAEAVLENAVRNAPIRYYDSRGRVLAHVAPSAQPYGWPRRNLFFQPNLERVLRSSLKRFANVELLASCEAIALSQDASGVDIVATTQEGARIEVRARYVVGADGGKSFVRKAIGVEMEGDTAPLKWLVVDVAQDTWDAPYSAVYTSPHRPAMTIPLPFQHRRFEFKVLDGEDADAMAEPAKVAELLAPFYADGPPPPAVRRRIYLHHSRTAETFRRSRVFLVGDAAHLQPPFFGQGMNSGIRDVTNLAWKLGLVITGKANPTLLDSYDRERRENARVMVEFATGIGKLYHPGGRIVEAIRNFVFRGLQRIPGAHDYILQMKYKPVPRFTNGFVVHGLAGKGSLVGRAFPQPLVARLDGSRVLLDEVLGPRIAVLGIVPGLIERLSPETLNLLSACGAVIVQSHVMPAYRRFGHFDPTTRTNSTGAEVADIYDYDGCLRDLILSRPQHEVFIIRPDRYVAAACSIAEIDAVARTLLAGLGDFAARQGVPNAPDGEAWLKAEFG